MEKSDLVISYNSTIGKTTLNMSYNGAIIGYIKFNNFFLDPVHGIQIYFKIKNKTPDGWEWKNITQKFDTTTEAKAFVNETFQKIKADIYMEFKGEDMIALWEVKEYYKGEFDGTTWEVKANSPKEAIKKAGLYNDINCYQLKYSAHSGNAKYIYVWMNGTPSNEPADYIFTKKEDS
jgi:hypothetical protein